MQKIQGGGGDFSLQRFLLSKGLAQPDFGSDLKWSKERKNSRSFSVKYQADAAKKKGYYMYSGIRDASVELISHNLKPTY